MVARIKCKAGEIVRQNTSIDGREQFIFSTSIVRIKTMKIRILSHPKRYKLIINPALFPAASCFTEGCRDLSEAQGFMGGSLRSLDRVGNDSLLVFVYC